MPSLAINAAIGYINKDKMLRNSFKLVSLNEMWIGTGQMHMTQGWNTDQKSSDKIVSTLAIFTS